MLNCRDCEFCKVGTDGHLAFGNVKEPECINKWVLLKLDMMVETYQATLRYYRRLAPLQERMFKHVEQELDDMDESDKWKLQDEQDDEEPNADSDKFQ